MSSSIPTSTQDLILDNIALSDEQCICSDHPTTYYNACRGELWLPSTVWDIGDVVHPPTPNGFVYECTVGGTSGTGEPGWGTSQDQTFSDNTVTWKTHTNYSLINQSLVSGDFTKSDGANGSRVLTIAQHVGVITHTSGIVTHTAYIRFVDKTVRFVSTAHTTISGDDEVVSGRTTIIFAHTITVPQPTVV